MRGGLMRFIRYMILLLLALPLFAAATSPVIDCVEIKTPAPNNAIAKFWYRVPKNYDATRRERYRVLVLFGGRNCDGKKEVSGKLGWPSWADMNGIFLVAPTFKDDAYWQPEAWSGRALLDALDAIGEKYRIAKTGLLFYGYSAGSQASNLFPAWRPDLCRAYVSHACGVFHTPHPRMRNVAALVTCGDADKARYVLTRRFANDYRALDIPIIWKSFENHPHDVPPKSIRLAKEFLAHHHWSHLEDLGGTPSKANRAAFAGDDANGVYHRIDDPSVSDIPLEDRVELPSETIASAWGEPVRNDESEKPVRPNISTRTIDGVEVVFIVPKNVRPDSRILILLGGRNWSGARSIRELGFARWAVSRGWSIIAPSFVKGEYWIPSNGAAEVLRKSIDALRQKHGVRPYPVFVFGYSAGGQLAALLSEETPFPIAAWGVLGCGVFPDVVRTDAPAVIICGIKDSDRLRISRNFVYRRRESGAPTLWMPVRGGHELNNAALELVRGFFAAVANDDSCALWGEDATHRVRAKAEIEIELRNPLYNSVLLNIWRSHSP
jgi:poly(3-hydroxybutyrate) depolymerase